ncbi:hypothetical protein V8E36_003212 [Tilletia maclaganii]
MNGQGSSISSGSSGGGGGGGVQQQQYRNGPGPPGPQQLQGGGMMQMNGIPPPPQQQQQLQLQQNGGMSIQNGMYAQQPQGSGIGMGMGMQMGPGQGSMPMQPQYQQQQQQPRQPQQQPYPAQLQQPQQYQPQPPPPQQQQQAPPMQVQMQQQPQQPPQIQTQQGRSMPTRNTSIASSSSASGGPSGAEQRDVRATAEIHYRDLLGFLQSHLAKAQTRPRSTAREKLTRLSKQQFTELSTDVYDELVRRQKALSTAPNGQSPGGPALGLIPPHLEVRPEFHPKRNQARQKLATLPKTRFKDLASDVFFELERRFPEFAEKYRLEAAAAARRASEGLDREPDPNAPPPLPTNSAYLSAAKQGVPTTSPILEEEDGTATPQPPQQPRSGSKNTQTPEAKAEAVAAKKKKMAQLTAALGNVDFGADDSRAGDSSNPISRDEGDEDDTRADVDIDADPDVNPENGRTSGDAELEDGEVEMEEDDDELDGLPIRKMGRKQSIAATRDMADDRSTMYSQGSSVGTGFLNGYTGSSIAGAGTGGSPAIGRDGAFSPSHGEIEKLRSDYEFRIAQLQAKVTSLEGERDQAIRDAELVAKQERERLEQAFDERLQDELSHHSQQHEERYEELQKQLQYTTSRLEFLNGEHNELVDRHREREELDAEYGDAATLREENDNLQKEMAKQETIVHELKTEVTSLLDELRALSERNDEMIAERDNDHIMIRELNSQLSNFKRRYDSARSELRAFKATSHLFVQPVKIDFDEEDNENGEAKSSTGSDLKRSESSTSRSQTASGPSWASMLSDRGAIADVHMRAFQVSIDELLASARSRVAGNVLMSMKTVVLAATLITDDVAKYSDGSEERENLQVLKTKSSAALSNLMTACRNYASSQGLSPVSLLDAAASHVSASVIEIVKLVRLRKASPQEKQELDATFGTGTDGLRTLQNGLKPLHIHAGIVSSNSNPPSATFPSSSGGDNRTLTSASVGSLNSKLNAAAAASSSASGDHESPSLSASNSGMGPDRQFSPHARTAPTMGRYSPVGYRPDATRKDSAGEGSWTSSNANGLSHDGSSLNGGGPGGSSGGSTLKGGRGGGIKGLTALNAESRSSLDTPVAEDDVFMRARSAAEEREENWAELRNYIKVQTDGIVHSIQNLLAAIREGAQGVQLNENLTQITTIVSSIIAISRENLPSLGAMGSVGASPATVARANEAQRILQELSANCDRLSEMQTRSSGKEDGEAPAAAAGADGKARGVLFDKATKTAMASSAYGVAKGLKALAGLLDDAEAAGDDLR